MKNFLNLHCSSRWLNKLQRIATLFIVLSVLFSFSLWAQDPLKIHFIDIGQGDCILVECPGGENVLIDCGSSSLDGKNIDSIYEYIDDITQNKLHTIVNTHPDEDHYNYLPSLLFKDISKLGEKGYDHKAEGNIKYDINQIITGGATGRGNGGNGDPLNPGDEKKTGMAYYKSHEYQYVLDYYRIGVLNETTTDPEELKLVVTQFAREVGTYIIGDMNSDFSIKIIANNSTGSIKDNDDIKNGNSIVLLIKYKHFKAITTGDATGKTTETILANVAGKNHKLLGEDLQDISLLQIAHHGSGNHGCNNDDWLNKITPAFAVSSNGSEQKSKIYGLPNYAVLEKINNSEILKEISSGKRSIKAYKKGKGNAKQLETEKALFSTGTDGTIVFTIEGDDDVKVESVKIGEDDTEVLFDGSYQIEGLAVNNNDNSEGSNDDNSENNNDNNSDEEGSNSEEGSSNDDDNNNEDRNSNNNDSEGDSTEEENDSMEEDSNDVQESNPKKRKNDEIYDLNDEEQENTDPKKQKLNTGEYLTKIDDYLTNNDVENAFLYMASQYQLFEFQKRTDRVNFVSKVVSIIPSQMQSQDCKEFWDSVFGENGSLRANRSDVVIGVIESLAQDNVQDTNGIVYFLNNYVVPFEISRDARTKLIDMLKDQNNLKTIAENIAIE